MIPVRLHAALDALSAAGLILGPTLLRWRPGLRGPVAAAGVGVALYSAATRYRASSRAPVSLRTHLALDAAQGLGFYAAAALSRRDRRDVRLAMAGYGLFSLAAAVLTDAPRETRRTVGRQVPLPADAVVRPRDDSKAVEIAPELAYQQLGIVNVAFLGPEDAGDRGWVLIDAGLTGTAGQIERAAAERFGASARPAAIVQTHGHFDHVGALETLAERWDAPVYAHPLEAPYLSGAASYPPGDPTVGGGAMAALSGLFPTRPVDVGPRLRPLPEDGGVPGAPGWRWLHTPGHAPGHVSLWHEGDRLLVAGDAVVTTRQESAYAALAQSPEMHGPPAYFTTDWDKARASVETLAALEPAILLTGHGAPMRGLPMRRALRDLAAHFDEVARPRGSHYA